jgi:hypothetical protein
MTELALLYGKKMYPQMDEARLMKLCHYHDIVETERMIDVTPVDGVTKGEKEMIEERDLSQILGSLHMDAGHAALVTGCVREYNEGKTAPAIMAKLSDTMDFVLSAYLKAENGDSPNPFFWQPILADAPIRVSNHPAVLRLVKDISSSLFRDSPELALMFVDETQNPVRACMPESFWKTISRDAKVLRRRLESRRVIEQAFVDRKYPLLP